MQSWSPAAVGAADAEIEVPYGENTELNVLPLKPGVGQHIEPYMLRLLPRISALLVSTLLVHSPAFFTKPLSSFSCVGCG